MYRPFLFVAIVGVVLTGRSPATMAADTAPTADTTTERAHARAELDRLNLEIDALKRRRRGIRDDYELRKKMADAEAVARRLTQLEGRPAPGDSPGVSAALGPAAVLAAPRARASDDRDVLEAKADILADQARRLDQQVLLLERRVDNLRARQELHRRAGELERDPFSPLEQASRRVLIAATPAREAAGPGSDRPATPDRGGIGTVAGSTPPPGQAAAPPSVGATTTLAPTGPSATGPKATDVAAPTEQASPVPVGPSSPAGTAAGGDAVASFATQFRGVLDASALAEIRKLESSGSGMGRLPAAEKALEALRGRARQLRSDADTIREQARARR